MRFKKGSRMEVLNQTDMSSGSWQCGEIVRGNGHSYTVRCGWRANGGNDGVVERVKNDSLAVDKNANLQDSHFISSRTLKRGSPSCAGAPQKCRATEKEGKINRVVAVNPSSLPEKVDAVVSSRELLDDKYMHTSFMRRKTGLSEMDLEGGKSNGAVGCSHAIGLEPVHTGSVSCSVGSCSVTSHIPYKLGHHCSTDHIADTDSECSDAESFCGRDYEEENSFLSTKEELEAEIHKLELHAYRSTIEALHASGPLNWEKETMVTNLRLLLHISNDEHLMELRRLVSFNSCSPVD